MWLGTTRVGSVGRDELTSYISSFWIPSAQQLQRQKRMEPILKAPGLLSVKGRHSKEEKDFHKVAFFNFMWV
jgi:hypothetical protein